MQNLSLASAWGRHRLKSHQRYFWCFLVVQGALYFDKHILTTFEIHSISFRKLIKGLKIKVRVHLLKIGLLQGWLEELSEMHKQP